LEYWNGPARFYCRAFFIDPNKTVQVLIKGALPTLKKCSKKIYQRGLGESEKRIEAFYKLPVFQLEKGLLGSLHSLIAVCLDLLGGVGARYFKGNENYEFKQFKNRSPGRVRGNR